MMPGRLDLMIDERDAATSSPGVSLDDWLAVLVRLLDLPAAQRESIRRELESHVRERTRDLMIDGRGEAQALHDAIAELGDTAELARTLRNANRYSRRRLVMNMGLCAVGAGIVGLGVLVARPDPLAPPAGRQYQPLAASEDGALQRRVDMRFEATGLGEVADRLAEELDRTVHVHWKALADHGIDEETTVTFSARSLPLRRVMELVRESIGDGWNEVQWSVGDDIVELGPRMLFDRRDIVLRTYDISAIQAQLSVDYGLGYEDAVVQVTELLQEFVEPDNWRSMGGILAELKVVGGDLFVEAPSRMHHQVAWILGELRDEDGAVAADDARDGAATTAERLRTLEEQNRELQRALAETREQRRALQELVDHTKRERLDGTDGPAPGGPS